MKSLRYNSFNYQKNIGDIIDNYKNNFVNESFESEEGANNIFILGTPRSGTTLIESIIASNDEVKSGGELLSANKLIQELIDHKEQDVKKFVNYLKELQILLNLEFFLQCGMNTVHINLRGST